MEIVYTNRQRGEERLHVELSATEVAKVSTGDPAATGELRTLLEAAARRFPTEAVSAQ